MNAVPARVAGVARIVMVTPPGPDGEPNPTVLAAAHLAGVREVYRVGGAQAIAALAYGTASIPRVDVISGPGNLWVTLAKKAVYGQVGIDSLAGPSEVLVIADHTARADQVAADLMAQAEHDPLAAAILITTSEELAAAVPAAVAAQLARHPRAAQSGRHDVEAQHELLSAEQRLDHGDPDLPVALGGRGGDQSQGKQPQ
jgi:histidinol dehydrogenase